MFSGYARRRQRGIATFDSCGSSDTHFSHLTFKFSGNSSPQHGEPQALATEIWGKICLNSAKHRPLTAWNHTWGEMRISFRDLLLKIYSTYLSTDHFSRHYRYNKAELLRRTQLEKRTWWNKNHSETAHHSENLWRCRGVLQKLSNRGYLRINMHLFTTNLNTSDLNKFD